MSIPYSGTDWQQALKDCKADVVSIATPGGAHFEPIKQAIAAGAHVFCDKPLTADGETAAELHRLAEAKGIKTAFAASFRYMPVNNNFTHKLSIVTSVIGEKILSVMGEVRDDMGRAPIVKGVHNFKTRREHIPDDLNDPSLEWGESNVEWSYNVTAKLESPFAKKPVSVLFKHAGLQPRFNEDYIAFYGSKGAIYIKGHYGSGPLYLYGADKPPRRHCRQCA